MYAKMKCMDLQAEKLRLIEWVLKLQDVELVKRLLEVKQASESAAYEASLKPMTVEELVARSRASDGDIQAGRFYDVDEVLKEDFS